MRISGSDSLKNIDRACVEELGIPMMVLMESAALRLYEHTKGLQGNKFVIIASTGNNGGDALALARHLKAGGRSVSVFVIGDAGKGSPCFQENLNIVRNMGMDIRFLGIDCKREEEQALQAARKQQNFEIILELRQELLKADAVVDGIFGVGLNREIKGIYREVIEAVNELSPFTICIDIPSGMHCDTGKILGCCVRGDMTVTFQLLKKGFLTYGSREYTGEVLLEAIGIPENIIEKYGEKIFITVTEYIKRKIRKRDLYSHKGSFGRTLIIGGSEGFYGAPVIASEAAVRCGSGLVTAAGSKDVIEVLRNKLKEVMTADTSDGRFKQLLEGADSIAIGPGMGTGRESRELLRSVIEAAGCPVIIDADGLNILAEENTMMELVKEKAGKGGRFVFTPHPGEMARLTGKSTDYVIENRMEIAREFAERNGIIVLLKGFNTVISDGENIYINPTGSSAMASGGMGDCLTGIIVSLLSQGLSSMDSAVCGAYLHGYCGDVLSEKMHSVNATDITEYLPYALKEMLY